MMDTQQFFAGIRGDNADQRFAAWRAAGEVPPSVIPELSKSMTSDNPAIAKGAAEALTTMTHAVGKDPQAANRAGVIKGLLEINSASYALPVRVHALRLLSNIAGESEVAAIAREIGNAELREEVVYCLERIPADAAMQALIKAYPQTGDDFKPRLLAAFGHRRVKAAVPLCVEAMRSSNPEIAIAGAKAFGRIGEKPAAAPSFPSEGGLSDWQTTERMDSMLRYADAQAEAGNLAEAMTIYKAALARPEEHWQCAGIVGIAKMGNADAAAVLLPLLKNPNRTVRLTAQKAWKGMAGA